MKLSVVALMAMNINKRSIVKNDKSLIAVQMINEMRRNNASAKNKCRYQKKLAGSNDFFFFCRIYQKAL